MAVDTFDLGPDESIVASQEFLGGGGLGNKAVLTTRRLVILGQGTRESHPLNKIQSIRVESGRKTGLLVFWITMAIFGLLPSLLVAFVYANVGSNPAIADQLQQGHIMVGVGLLLTLGSAWGAIVAARGFVRLAVELQSGVKAYEIQKQDEALLSFVQRVEQAL